MGIFPLDEHLSLWALLMDFPVNVVFFPVQSMLPLMSSREDEDSDRAGSTKRGILPKQATQIMKTWLFQHIVV